MKTYESIFKKFRGKTILADVALMDYKEPEDLLSISEKVLGPIVTGYVLWVLKEAEQRKLKTLYFLARDGYILYKIAQGICQKFKIPITCKYLYCSRNSLRLPTYALIGDEAFDLLLDKGNNMTAYKLLERVGFSEVEREEIYQAIGFDFFKENDVLSDIQFYDITTKLKANEKYKRTILTKSKDAYDVSVGYMCQEGLLRQKTVAIVDSGWNCTLQRSLRQLLESAGYKGDIIGFYFGLFVPPKNIADGEYLTFYFSANNKMLNKIFFSNNLFEVILSAPHGTTLTYIKEDEKYIPVIQNDMKNYYFIQRKNKGILSYFEMAIEKLNLIKIDFMMIYKLLQGLLQKMMVSPSKKEIAIWSNYYFSDDITDSLKRKFIDESEIKLIKNYLLLNRVKKGRSSNCQKVYWPWGVLQCLSLNKRLWYQIDFFVGELLRFYAMK